MLSLTVPVMVTFGVFMMVMLAIGLWTYSDVHSHTDFALGGRRLSAPVAALSAGASDMSGWLLLGLPGAVYAAGIGAGWIAVGLIVGTYLNWKFVAPRLRTYTELADGSLTLAGYLEGRFEDRTRAIRVVSSAVTVLFFTVYVASGFVACGLLFEEAFGLDYESALTVSAVVIVAYVLMGGFLGVSVMNTLQGSLMFLALLVLPVLGIVALGGFGALLDEVAQRSSALLDPGAEAALAGSQWSSGEPLGIVAVVSLLAWGLGYFGQPHILAHFMAIRSAREIPTARRISVGWAVCVLTGAVFTGLVGVALFEEPLDSTETVFIDVSAALTSPWFTGLLLLAVLAAIKSTLDSQLMVSAAALAEDFYRAFRTRRPSDTVLLALGRAAVLVVALTAYAFALRGGAVLDIVSYAWAGFGAAFGPVVVLSLYWPRMTAAGAMAGMCAGAGTVFFWKQIDALLGPLETGIYEMVPGVVASTAAVVLVSRVSRPPERRWAGPMSVADQPGSHPRHAATHR